MNSFYPSIMNLNRNIVEFRDKDEKDVDAGDKS